MITAMITKFQIVDTEGNIIGHGEIDGDIYRVFSVSDLPGGYKEFESLTALFAGYGGVAIQPELFETPARAR